MDRFITFVTITITVAACWLFSSTGPVWSQAPASTADSAQSDRAQSGERPGARSALSGQGNASQTTTGEQTKAQQLDGVYRELSKMIPGGVAGGSPLEASIKKAISLFADQNPANAKKAMLDLAAKEERFPPSDLMLAALAYAVNDNLAGKRLLEQAAITNPDYPDIHFSFGQLALTQQRFSDAEAQAEFALQKIKRGSFDQVFKDHFKQRYYEIKFQLAKSRNKTDEAKKLLQQLNSIAPDSPQALFGKAEYAFEDNNVDQAIELLDRLNEVSGGPPQVPQLTIARWYQRKGKTENADMWIRKAAAENGSNSAVQMTAARWAMSREHFREALQILDRLEATDGKTNTSRELRGKIAFAQGAYETAGALFEKLLGENPNNIDFANLLSLAMVQNTDQEIRKRAARLAQKVASLEPNNPVALSSLAYALLKTGEIESAQSILAKVVQIPNPSAEVSFIIASMLAETGQMPQSEKILAQLAEKPGLFLFRSEAEKLLKTVRQSSQALPERGQ